MTEPLGRCLNTRGGPWPVAKKPAPNPIEVRGRPETSRLGRGVSRVLFPQPSLWDERRRSPQASLPQVVANRASSPWRVAPPERDVGLAADGVCLAAPVARGTGALLPHRFTLTGLTRPSAFCCTIPSGYPAQPLAGILPCAARTFLWCCHQRLRPLPKTLL